MVGLRNVVVMDIPVLRVMRIVVARVVVLVDMDVLVTTLIFLGLDELLRFHQRRLTKPFLRATSDVPCPFAHGARIHGDGGADRRWSG